MSSDAQHVPEPIVRRIGVVGLGRMGTAFAANLLDDAYENLTEGDRMCNAAGAAAGSIR